MQFDKLQVFFQFNKLFSQWIKIRRIKGRIPRLVGSRLCFTDLSSFYIFPLFYLSPLFYCFLFLPSLPPIQTSVCFLFPALAGPFLILFLFLKPCPPFSSLTSVPLCLPSTKLTNTTLGHVCTIQRVTGTQAPNVLECGCGVPTELRVQTEQTTVPRIHHNVSHS